MVEGIFYRFRSVIASRDLPSDLGPFDPFARAGTGDAHLCRDVGDGSRAASLDEPTAPFDGQRCIPVRHWAAPGADARRSVSRLSTAW